ncbi:hypothetical protein M405DRAFT_830498 [Rhizopogon salebrosus TDB-379]|nr:hypothetical protein M405DRAFT_830498 [Rhizopogon salebrosus TDB-379]
MLLWWAVVFLMSFMSLWRRCGRVPFPSARLASDSIFSLPIPIMYISMFELAMRHNAQGLFLCGRSL